MFIDHNIDNYIVNSSTSVLTTLKMIDAVNGRIKIIVNSHKIVIGIITNGDILRWLIQNPSPNLNTDIGSICNKSFKFVTTTESKSEIESFLRNVLFLPILDSKNRVISIATRKSPVAGFEIDGKTIGPKSPCFIIAEIGNNHNGCVEAAKNLVDIAKSYGADCAKFQMRQLDHLYDHTPTKTAPHLPENLGTEYTLDLLSKYQLTNSELFEVFDYCKKVGITPLCSPWDEESLFLLNDYGMDAFKFASADLTNHSLIEKGIDCKKPLLISTGMSIEKEILSIIELLKNNGATFALLHCNSTYPAPFNDLNLRYINRLRKLGDCPVGYSGHERGINATIAAVSLDSNIIEKHITTDRSQKGNDHKASLLPNEFKEMVEGIREVEMSLGSQNSRNMGQGEMINRINLSKSLATKSEIKVGEVITKDKIAIMSPGKGLQPCYLNQLLGLKAKRNFAIGDFFYPSDTKEEKTKRRNYSFRRPWGIPVRFHDYKSLTDGIKPDFVEFHLSYKDLDMDFNKFIDAKQNCEIIVHSPELFADDHLLDLCSPDSTYRNHSIKEMQRVISLVLKLRSYFKNERPTLLVTNVGGHSIEGFLPGNEKKKRYANLRKSLACLETEKIEIIPQTMPPFPWHFGGQRFHNLFVDHNEIIDFAKNTGLRICFDISHTNLACALTKNSIFEVSKKIAPLTAHLHIADAIKTDGEGLQIGSGDIDFAALNDVLDEFCPNISFIPEIWQGHENNGEGFWIALERLERIFNQN